MNWQHVANLLLQGVALLWVIWCLSVVAVIVSEAIGKALNHVRRVVEEATRFQKERGR